MDTSHIHPMLVHFPIVLIVLGFAVDFYSIFILRKNLCLNKSAFIILIMATLASVVGFYSGEFFTDEYTGLAHEMKEQHEVYAKITMYTMIAASVVRLYGVWRKSEKRIFLFLSFGLLTVAVIFVAITGFTGGELVYNVLIGN